MSSPVALAALALALLGLAACDKRNADPPLPSASSQLVLPSVADPSVPPAASVLMPAAAPTAQDAASGHATRAMSMAEQSNAMPMPGQVNNHSTTALDPVTRGASAP